MKILNAEFITSSDCLKNCPDFDLPEFAIVGRSNVGKSSLINAITGKKGLAKTSNTPGKTRTINFYKINDKLILTDLPGYGYAKLSKLQQQIWKKNLEEYLACRKALKAIIQLIDSRLDIQNNDLQMRNWLEYHKLSIITIATKIDNLSNYQSTLTVQNFAEILNTEIIPFSAKTGYGKDKILSALEIQIKG